MSYSDSKLDAEEAGYDKKLGAYISAFLQIAQAIVENCRIARGSRDKKDRTEDEPSPALALARVSREMEELETRANEDMFDIFATTIPPEAMAARHRALLDFIMVKDDGRIPILKDHSMIERAASRYIDACQDYKDVVELRPRSPINTGEMTVAFQPRGLPIGVGMGLESGDFVVSVGIDTPIGTFSISGGGSSTVEVLEIRAYGKRRFFRLNRDFKVFTPENLGTDITMQDGGKTFIMDVKGLSAIDAEIPKPERRPKKKKIVYDNERHHTLGRYHEVVKAASFLSEEEKINWYVMGGRLTTKELTGAIEVVLEEDERIERGERAEVEQLAAAPRPDDDGPGFFEGAAIESADRQPVQQVRRGARLDVVEGWVVRVSSDSSLDDAEVIESQMQDAGFDTAIVEHDNYFCVVLGNYASEAEVRSAADRAAEYSPRGDKPYVHEMNTWCGRQLHAEKTTKCVEYAVRISSTRSLADARAAKVAAEESGYTAFISQDGDLYRVFGGWYVRRSEAERYIADLGSILGQGATIIRVRKYCPEPTWDDDVMQCIGDI